MLKSIIRALLKVLFRVKVEGDTSHFSRAAAAHHRQPPVLPRWPDSGSIPPGRSGIRGAYRSDPQLVFPTGVAPERLPGGRSHQPDGDEARGAAHRIRPPGGDFPGRTHHHDGKPDEGLRRTRICRRQDAGRNRAGAAGWRRAHVISAGSREAIRASCSRGSRYRSSPLPRSSCQRWATAGCAAGKPARACARSCRR